jgi:hypothetical protein
VYLSDVEQRCRLETALHEAEDALDDTLIRGGDVEAARLALNLAQADLDAWGKQILQVIPAPIGMVAVFERRDGQEEHIPVSYLALHRSGRVLPYIYIGNCEPLMPAHAPNFLRVDHHWPPEPSLSISEIGRELLTEGSRTWRG